MPAKDQSYKAAIYIVIFIVILPALYGVYSGYIKLLAQVRAISVFTTQRYFPEAMRACNKELEREPGVEKFSVENGGKDLSYFWYDNAGELQVSIRIPGNKRTCYYYADGQTFIPATGSPD